MQDDQIILLFNRYKKDFQTFERINLLKKIETTCHHVFRTHEEFEEDRNFFGTDEESQKKLIAAVIESSFEGIEDFSDEFYSVYDIAIKAQQLQRKFTLLALDEFDHDFLPFEESLIRLSIDLSNVYDLYYKDWLKQVRNSEAAKKIIEMRNDNPSDLENLVKDKGLNNFYTIIDLDGENFVQKSYSEVFSKYFQEIKKIIDNYIETFNHENSGEESYKYIRYLEQYLNSLLELNIHKLEEQGKKLDEIWMDMKHDFQLVHDIEYGYGDPLRTKVIPDFSFRIVDDTYAKENEQIKKIHDLMISYFSKRKSNLCKMGLRSLENSFAAIYYIPFHTGISYHFRMSGQSIPNRYEVRSTKGTKIYFDPISTSMRIQKVQNLVRKIFGEPSLVKRIDHLDSIVNHVAAHEFGHGIYGLEALSDKVKIATRSLLEEPRAELTALTVMKLMYEENLIHLEDLQKTLFNFAASDLRRFVMFDSEGTWPYTISAINTYKTYEDLEYITRKDDKLVLNDQKTLEVLTEFQKQFEEILDAEDEGDGEKLEQLLSQMQEKTEMVDWLVEKLKV